MDRRSVPPVSTTQADRRNSQKFELDDACCLKSNPSLVGHVTRTFYDVDEHEPLDEVLIVRYTEVPEQELIVFTATGVPPKGYVFVSFIEPSQGCSLVHEDDLELIDRALELGDTVKRHPDDTMSGTVISTTGKCTIEPIAFRPIDPITGEYGHLRFTETPFSNPCGYAAPETLGFKPPLLRDVPLSELMMHEEFSEGDYIVYQQKVGVIQMVERDAVLLLPSLKAVSPLDSLALELPLCTHGRRVVRVPDTDFLKCRDVGNNVLLFTSDSEFIYPGQSVLTSASNINRGDLPPGNQKPIVQGYVLATPAMDVHINWLCPNVFTSGLQHDGPNSEVLRVSTLQANALSCDFGRVPSQSSASSVVRCDQLEIGERVRFRDVAGAIVKYPRYQHIPADETFGCDLNIFRIISSKTMVTVQWQDGSVTTEAATSLRKVIRGDDELWPGNFVILKNQVVSVDKPLPTRMGPFSHFPHAQKEKTLRIPRIGVVQSVDSRERIASVRWFQNTDIELMHQGNVLDPRSSLGQLGDTATMVSIYELTTYAAIRKNLGELVVLAPASVDQSAISPATGHELVGEAGACQLSFLSPLSFLEISFYLQSVKTAMIDSEWFRNTTTVRAPSTRRRYSVYGGNTRRDSPVDFFGKIVAIDTNGIITVRLPDAYDYRDIQVSLERVLAVVDTEDTGPTTPLSPSDLLDFASSDPSGSRGHSPVVTNFEYDGGERLDNDDADDDWTTEEEGDDSVGPSPVETVPAPESIAELEPVMDEDVVMTGMTGLSLEVHPTRHEGEVSVDNTAHASQESSLPILAFPVPTSSPPSFAVLDGLPPRDHHFIAQPLTGSSPLRMRRIGNELAILESSLPSGIFVRTWGSRIDLLRVMILGPEGTPYEYAPFVIDIYLADNFPEKPPVTYFHSWTTGQGPVNPNLYEDGNICLSILGTWPTQNPDENWSPQRSTLLQVLVSIMGLVLVKAPFYNEAGYEVLAAEDSRRVESSQYTEKAFLMTRRFILRALRRPVSALEDVLAWHYLPDQASLRPQLLRRSIYEALRMIHHHHRTSGQDKPDSEASEYISRLSLGAVYVLTKQLAALQKLETDLAARMHS